MNFFNFNKRYPLLITFIIIALLLSVFFAISLLNDLFQIHIYRHDSLYNIPLSEYRQKVYSEGRWINYIFYPITTLISGKLLSLVIMLSFFYFFFITSYRWTKNFYYASLISLLFLQIPSFYAQILWPAGSVSAFLVLFLSTFLVQRLPIYIFYILFGILFFATMSNIYYLLPLLHLNLLNPNNLKENFKLFFLKIVPAWAIGFIIGYLVTQLILYIKTGHFMHIKSWRNPHYIHSIDDLTHNILSSLNFFESHINYIFSNSSWIVLAPLALFITYTNRKKDLLFIPLILFFLIMIVHYIIVLPIGIYIDLRTAIATWVGILAIIFFIPSVTVKQWKIFFLTPIIVFFTFTLYEKNHANLEWYSTITNTHFDYLLKESPKSPELYKGVVLLANDADILKRIALVSKQYNVHKDLNMMDLYKFPQWSSSALEAGFKSVIMCNKSKSEKDYFDKTTNVNLLCQEVLKIYKKDDVLSTNYNTFYNILGKYNGRLIISFNENWRNMQASP